MTLSPNTVVLSLKLIAFCGSTRWFCDGNEPIFVKAHQNTNLRRCIDIMKRSPASANYSLQWSPLVFMRISDYIELT